MSGNFTLARITGGLAVVLVVACLLSTAAGCADKESGDSKSLPEEALEKGIETKEKAKDVQEKANERTKEQQEELESENEE